MTSDDWAYSAEALAACESIIKRFDASAGDTEHIFDAELLKVIENHIGGSIRAILQLLIFRIITAYLKVVLLLHIHSSVKNGYMETTEPLS